MAKPDLYYIRDLMAYADAEFQAVSAIGALAFLEPRPVACSAVRRHASLAGVDPGDYGYRPEKIIFESNPIPKLPRWDPPRRDSGQWFIKNADGEWVERK